MFEFVAATSGADHKVRVNSAYNVRYRGYDKDNNKQLNVNNSILKANYIFSCYSDSDCGS